MWEEFGVGGANVSGREFNVGLNGVELNVGGA